MAMLALFEDLRARFPAIAAPLVLTVDHGLRAGFAAEAALVAEFCATRGLAHRVLAWKGAKPATGLMAAARAARYRLLADAARQAGHPLLLTAHTADDRTETAAMRAARGATAFAGLERLTLIERDIVLLRPLLGESREALRAFNAARAIPFADDPTNADLRHERSRVRLARPLARAATLEAAQAERQRASASAAAFLDEAARWQGEGDNDAVTVRPAPDVARADQALALRFLAACLAPAPYPASPATGERLAALLADGANGAGFSAARLLLRKRGGVLLITRDPRHAALALPSGRVEPFEAFCPEGMLPLANALARLTGAPPFIMPGE
jgi:tRNA(Ile)-lysidine synthase